MESQTKRAPLKCPGCKKEIDVHAPTLWFPRDEVHEYTQQLVIMTHMLCCGHVSHTEPVATVSAYLRDVKGNARLVCNMVCRLTREELAALLYWHAEERALAGRNLG